MTTTHHHPSTDFRPTTATSPATTARRRGLLLGGTLAAPVFVGSTLVQASTRDGFDLTRHAASLLSNGDLGWIQTLTFLVTGALVTGAALGLRTSLRGRPGGTWGPRLLVVYGLSFVAAGLFPADPALGFPVGTPDAVAPVTPTGAAHMASGMIGFLAAIAACLVIARGQRRSGQPLRAGVSAATGVFFLAAMVGIMSGSGSASAPVTLGFWFAIAASLAWLAGTCASARRS